MKSVHGLHTMMASPQTPLTLDEYLQLEAASTVKQGRCLIKV